jgi:hypothetical protein
MTICSTAPSPNGNHCLAALSLAAALGAGVGAAHAEEGGSGHYLPGSMASFADAVAPKETFVLRGNLVNYSGSVGKTQPLPIAGVTALGAEAKSTALGLTAFWRPPIEFGEGWSYAMSATLPFVWMDVTADITARSVTASRTSSVNALGDLVLIPLMLNQSFSPDFNINYRLAAYAPTGSYEVGRLANTGKNFWTVEPTVGFIYFGQKNGREASVFVGADFNRENPDTHYKSGQQFHIDGILSQHFPWQGGLAGVGLNGYYYKQLTGDSGSGASFGDFKAKTVGFGPVVSFVTKINGHDTIAEFKWLHETGTVNRLQGDLLWLKVLYKFY